MNSLNFKHICNAPAKGLALIPVNIFGHDLKLTLDEYGINVKERELTVLKKVF